LERARTRDQGLLGSATDIERCYRHRYVLAQQTCFVAVEPNDYADSIVDNDDLQ
jgi:hypothetical protein